MAAWLHAAAALTCLSLAWRIHRVRATPCRGWLLAFVLAVTWWAACAAMAGVGASSDWYLTWSRLAFVGIAFVPVLWLAFIDAFMRSGGRLRSWLPALAVLPVVTVGIVLAEPRMGLMIVGALELPESAGAGFELVRGPWYWLVHLPYSYALLALGMLQAASYTRVASRPIRRQLAVMIVAIVVPVLANLLERIGVVAAGAIDLTAVAFTLAALLMAWALLARRFLELPPASYRPALEEASASVLIVDAQRRIVDANPAAVEIFGLDRAASWIPLGRILPSVSAALRHLPAEGGKLCLPAPRLPNRQVDVEVTPIAGLDGSAVGHVLIVAAALARADQGGARPVPAEVTSGA